MGKQCWRQAVLESGSWGHSVLQTPALVYLFSELKFQMSTSKAIDISYLVLLI